MVTTETITIEVPVGMSKYLEVINPELELTRNALLLYPYILNQTISHGRAAEIIGIRKSELIELYDKLGYSYFDIIQDDLDDELNSFRELKKKDYNFNTQQVVNKIACYDFRDNYKSFETKWRKEWNLTKACSNILTVMKT